MENRIREVEKDVAQYHEQAQEQYRHIIENQTRNTEAIERLSASTASLVEAWRTANSVAKFLKWMGGIALAFGAIYEFILGRPWH